MRDMLLPARVLLQCRVAIYSRRITVTSADGKYKRKETAAAATAAATAVVVVARILA